MELRLIYTSAAGASIIRTQPHNESKVALAMAALCRRHIGARLMCGSEKIGEVFKQDGKWRFVFDPAFVRP